MAFIDYHSSKKQWIISPTAHRAIKHCTVVNGNMVLKSKQHKEVKAAELEKHLDKVTGGSSEAEVYEVAKIHDRRVNNGDIEYRCSWKGYNKNHKTWEPMENLYEYGAGEMVTDFEVSRAKHNYLINYFCVRSIGIRSVIFFS